ncbi:hypothetical protein ACYJ1Y_16990 [Natrialbaceae archaeon A-gly3]
MASDNDEYGLEIDGAVSTPEQTEEIRGEEYTFDGTGAIESGDPIHLSVSSSEDYRLYLYNSNEQSEYTPPVFSPEQDQITVGDDGDISFDTENLEPGTYMFSLETDERKAVYPVVVEGYDLSLDYPEEATVGEEVTVGASVSPGELSAEPDEVRVAIWDGEDVKQVTLEHTGSFEYEASIDLTGFDETEYEVYGAILGDDEVEGHSTSLAIEAGHSLKIDAESSGSEEDDDEGSSGGGGGGIPSDDGDGDDDDSTDSSDGDESDDESSSEISDDGSTDSTTDETTADGTSDEEQNSTTGDENDSIISPSEQDLQSPSNGSGTDAGGQDSDGLGLPATPVFAAILLTVIGYLVGRHE